jgi:cation transport protein ChaC
MVVDSYRPSWVKLDADGRELIALTFVVRRDHPQYARGLTVAKQVDVLDSACGAFGSSLDYLERTRVALVAHGIVDPYLERLAANLAQRRSP